MQFEPTRVPQQWDAISAQWMTGALQARLPGVQVADVRVLMRDDGTNRRARLGVRYAQGEGPATLFAKAHAAAHREAHLRNGNLWNEARLFASALELPIEHPRVYAAMVDTEALDFLLLMEDLALRDADPRDATRPMTPEQVARGLRGLARLHSRYMNVAPDAFEGLQTWRADAGWQPGLLRHVPIGLTRTAAVLPARVAALDAQAVVGQWTRYVSLLPRAPLTLLHGDAHIGNTYVLPDGEVGFLDWQVVRRGRWSQDVGYFLIGALTPDDRRRHEAELLELYRTALDVPEAQRPAREDAWLEYCATPAYGLAIWLSTAGTDGYQRLEVSTALVERYAQAYADLDTPKALDALGV